MTKASDYMTALNTADINAAELRPDSDTLRDRCTAYVLQHIEHAYPHHVEDLMDLVRDEVSRDVAQAPSHVEQTPAGIIDWKMECARLNRLLAAAEADESQIRLKIENICYGNASLNMTPEACAAQAKRITDAILEQCEVRLRAHSPPVFHAPHNSGERLPSGDAAVAGGDRTGSSDL